MALRNAVQLICYPDRMGEDLSDLYQVLDAHLNRAIGGVHILPVYPSNADAGFSPLTHKEIDPAYGTWDDIERISVQFDLCLDLMINHISDESVEFRDFVENGHDSEYSDLFVHRDHLGDISDKDLAKIYIRKEKEPFRKVEHPDGTTSEVWCTFTERQIDLNYDAEHAYELMEDYVRFLSSKGVKLFRLDAFGYTTKRIGTSCFMVEPDVYEICKWIDGAARSNGAETLAEVHDHHSYQYAISLHAMRPYGFALPMLALHALLNGDSRYLKPWLRMCPRNQITVLDTHDGICIPDVEGLLPEPEIQSIIDSLAARSADPILRRSAANVHSVGAIYQITCTFYDALERDDNAYIAARAIQFFTPGIPQVYYIGLLAGTNDQELADSTGEPRDINRRAYSLSEVDLALGQKVVRRLLRLMEFRSTYAAFDGTFHLHYSTADCLSMEWRKDENVCSLDVDLNTKKATIRYVNPKTQRTLTMVC